MGRMGSVTAEAKEWPKLFRIGPDGQCEEVHGGRMRLEADLQRQVETGMEVMLGVRLLASEYPTGPWHSGRIDSLGLDQQNSPVVIEYKRGTANGVVSQAVSYLAWVRSAPHEFKALTRERLGVEAAESIKYLNPRIVCIAADFSQHDRVAAHHLPWSIDLLRYRVFDGGLLSLSIETSRGPESPARARRSRERPTSAG